MSTNSYLGKKTVLSFRQNACVLTTFKSRRDWLLPSSTGIPLYLEEDGFIQLHLHPMKP